MKTLLKILVCIFLALFFLLFTAYRVSSSRSQIEKQKIEDAIREKKKHELFIKSIERDKKAFRGQYAELLENAFKDTKYRILVTVSGDKNEILTIASIFIDSYTPAFKRDHVYDLWKTMGFKRVIIMNGSSSERIDLSKYQTLDYKSLMEKQKFYANRS